MTTIDWTPIIESGIGLCALIITTFGSIALKAIAKKFNIDANGAAVQNFDAAMRKAVQAGAAQTEQEIKDLGYDHTVVKDNIIARGVVTAVAKFKPAIEALGVDPSTDEGQRYIREELQRVLPQAMKEYADSPATPSVPLPDAAVGVIAPAPAVHQG